MTKKAVQADEQKQVQKTLPKRIGPLSETNQKEAKAFSGRQGSLRLFSHDSIRVEVVSCSATDPLDTARAFIAVLLSR